MAGAGKPAGARARARIAPGACGRAGIADGARARVGIAASLPARAGIAAGPRARARIVRATPTFAPNITAQAHPGGAAGQCRLVAPGMSKRRRRSVRRQRATRESFGTVMGSNEVNTSISSVKKPEAVKLLLAQDAWRVSKGVDPD
ncbi:unnamed protein product [Ectocarpus sp. CCAP 1310/34]|nr:unnamed protein product [Ectocarpus sp. CCAP 1310/34]